MLKIRNQKIRIGLRSMRFHAVERFHDLLNVSLPIFIVMGLLVATAKFWLWLLMPELLACFR